MAALKNSILLNGKVYDVQSGASVASAFVFQDIQPHATPSPHTSHSAKKPSPARSKVHQTAKHTAAHHPERTKTLMRSSVQKPHNLKHTIHAQKTAEHTGSEQPHKAHPTDRARHSSSHQVAKSEHIRHFAPHGARTHTIKKTTKPLAVKAPPADAYKRIASEGWVSSIETGPEAPADLWTRGLAKAESHLQPRLKKASHKKWWQKAHVVGGTAVGVAMISFLVWHNMLGLKLAFANRASGIQAHLPSYRLPGYSFDSISHSPGNIAISYHSNSDARAYSVTQQVSGWDSQTLATEVLGTSTDHQTIEQKGKTIYVYGSTATWVGGGMRYQIKSDNPLSSEQISQIANSL